MITILKSILVLGVLGGVFGGLLALAAKIFYVEVYDGDQKLAEGSGHNKKGAQQQAAYAALLSLKNKN